ncbi:hypothetical protein KCV02_g13216, partial [Aureobasidium melanogenum]
MDSRELLEERAAIVSDIVEGLQDLAVSEAPTEGDAIESETLSASRSAPTSDSNSSGSEQTHEERDWINDTPKWNPPTELALHSVNQPCTPEWRIACSTLNTVVAKAEMTKTSIDSKSFEPSALFSTLVIKPRKKDLRKLKHAIQQPFQPPYLAEFSFDCSAIKTRKDVDDLGKCREPIVDILKMLYGQGRTSDAV